MDTIELYLSAFPLLFPSLILVLGLLVGSFLNVVILRLPVMLDRQWREQCRILLSPDAPASEMPRFDLAHPGSHCPLCRRPIRAWENIPLVSFLLLRGKCAGCGKPISWRYPSVELATGLLSAVVAWHFGFGLAVLAALLFTWTLIALTVIDADTQLLPDDITLPLLWAGLLFNLDNLFAPLPSAIIGAVAGYGLLWLVFHAFRLLTGKEGMGYGDFKLFAALGAWLGWQQLPLILLFASLIGAIVGLASIVFLGRDRRLPIPFGPYLCGAGWVALLWGEPIMRSYIQYARF